MSEPIARPRPERARSRIGTWFDHHAYSFVASLGRIFRRPWSTALTIGVMAVALALPLGLWLVLGNVERFAGDVQQSRQLSVFLKQDVTPDAVAALADALRGRADVGDVAHRTPAQGLEELRARGGLGQAIDALGENPLPHVLVVTPAGDEAMLADSLRTLPEADLVQHDAGWRQRLDGWLRFGGRVAWVLAALLGTGALLVVGNTVRLDIQSRRDELGVLQLLGASDGFIRRPFLYLGAWYGLAAGALALALLTAAGAALRLPLADLAASYGSGFGLVGFTARQALVVLAGTTALGWLGAGAVTGHFLRQTRPTDT
ncbi:permease-like cell division protein FtsX [Luteimonas sp. MC1825]|uniref:permease-like cell division protein FtsX n=1 Tax=Luteimonas sp. MC1825 TaxID=2761107 RepID=UPI001616C3FC|nr:permease-like cell division protein FtsX [Luteimonas sp. MC1825]MBB6600375.1 ABC transporter permease [Luteimonas sp. MC1825]QOC88050.1 ABC transporter permease [Luteimonas sp. MC1825]